MSISFRLLLVAIAVAMFASAAQGISEDDPTQVAAPTCADTCG